MDEAGEPRSLQSSLSQLGQGDLGVETWKVNGRFLGPDHGEEGLVIEGDGNSR